MELMEVGRKERARLLEPVEAAVQEHPRRDSGQPEPPAEVTTGVVDRPEHLPTIRCDHGARVAGRADASAASTGSRPNLMAPNIPGGR